MADERVGQNSSAFSLPPDFNFNALFGSYLQREQERLELVFERAVHPLFEAMMEGARERGMYLDLADYYRATRSGLWRKGVFQSDEEQRIALNLDTGLFEYTRSRSGDEMVVGNELIWLMYHVLHNVYGVPLGTLWEIDESITGRWRQMFGSEKEILSPDEQRLQQLAAEADLIRAYNAQYADFAETHRNALRRAIYETHDAQGTPLIVGRPLTSTPGSTRRSIFNAVLYTGYRFDPRRREEWQLREERLNILGKPIRSMREKLESRSVDSAVVGYLRSNFKQISAMGAVSSAY